jgi:hypothetical protein
MVGGCLQATQGLGQSWLAAALLPLPQHAANDADKQAVLHIAQAAADGDTEKGWVTIKTRLTAVHA